VDRPMRLDGPTAFELVLGRAASWIGLLALAWTVAAVAVPEALLPASSVLAGLLAGAVGAAGLCLILAGGDVRRALGTLDLGLALLALAAAALIVAGALEGRTWAIVSGVVILTVHVALGLLRREAVRAGYRPRWFGKRSFETMIATVETVLDAEGREAIPPARAAANTDLLLSRAQAPILARINLMFIVLEWAAPLLRLRPTLPFSRLGPLARREILERLIEHTGLFRSFARTMKVLTCAGYYGDPATMRAIGFVEYEGGPRSRNQDLAPRTYPDPTPASPVPPTAGRVSEHVDAVVIGSGASGSVMAYELARRNLKVVVLERGRHEDPQTFEHLELAMFPRLYKYGGLQIADDNNTAIFQGATVGGSTVINNAIWLRPDLDVILAEWRKAGADVPKDRLVAAYEDLEHRLHVRPIEKCVANPGTEVFLAGAGPTGKLLENNRKECLGCGWCNYGCRYNRKTSMLVTYIPWAMNRGVEVLDQVSDVQITHDGARASGVTAKRNGASLTFKADKVVVCAGAIGSSELLLKNEITANGNVGKRLHVLGGVFVTGDMRRVVDGFAGIGLTATAYLNQEPYVLESYFAPPLAFSARVGGWMLSHFERVERYRHFIDGGVMVGTDPADSQVTLKGGRANITLKPSAQNISDLKRGIERMAGIYFKAGAERVYPSTFKYIDLTPANYAEEIDSKIQSMDDILFGSAHPQGGNVMSENPAAGVVGENFEVHGLEGLYVADTSVWPSNIRANCQATAMAMSHYAAERITGEALI
jgi:choline dehydrogenase-like flavoprotein